MHQIRITRGGSHLLRVLISQPGWAKKRAHHRRGKELLAIFPKEKAAPKDTDASDEAEAWAAVVVERQLTESQRKIGATCLKHFMDAGAFGCTDHTDQLLAEFGITDE